MYFNFYINITRLKYLNQYWQISKLFHLCYPKIQYFHIILLDDVQTCSHSQLQRGIKLMLTLDYQESLEEGQVNILHGNQTIFLQRNITWRKKRRKKENEQLQVVLLMQKRPYKQYKQFQRSDFREILLDFVKLRGVVLENLQHFSSENISRALSSPPGEKGQSFCRDIRYIFSLQCSENTRKGKLHRCFFFFLGGGGGIGI